MTFLDEKIAECKNTSGKNSQYANTVEKIIGGYGCLDFDDYRVRKAIEEIVEPDRVLSFDIKWTDDAGKEQVNHAYRVQASNLLGPYKGGLRFHPTVNEDILKSLALEQILKNSLTTLELGGAKGGADFDPKGKSDAEVERFCAALIEKLDKHIGADKDCPAGDIGVGAREIKAMCTKYLELHPEKKIADALTGKAVTDGGSLCRTQATGYGLVYFVQNYLEDIRNCLCDKQVLISGSGNVAIYAAEKCAQLGATVLTVSDSDGYVYDSEGIDVSALKEVKEVQRGRVSDYAKNRNSAKYVAGKRPWEASNNIDPGCIILPCATQNEIEQQDAVDIVNGKAMLVAEGSNLSTTSEAIKILRNADVKYFPGKASNAGGVAVSGLEMIQNKANEQWSFDEVDNKLKEIMLDIYRNLQHSNKTYMLNDDFLAAANIAGLQRIIDKM